ncbi:MAG: hypothetical protein ACSLFJ_02720 [Immundisolibacter sp.]|uniref:hypothetical protein n=1 Tax=Immundisolibacter sp. TaxID=1934948 RepID=UPI003EE321B7
MKTTLELPDELMRAIKVQAAATDRKLKDVVAELIARGLQKTPSTSEPPLDLTQYIGKWPRYQSQDDVVEYVRELRKDRDED